MLIAALCALALFFLGLFVFRLGAATRARWLSRWPSIAALALSGYLFYRGGISAAVFMTLVAVVVLIVQEVTAAPKPAPVSARDLEAHAQARATLGVGPNASASEIRAAYRAQMAQHHPDIGGQHERAVRLAAARDLLLKQKR